MNKTPFFYIFDLEKKVLKSPEMGWVTWPFFPLVFVRVYCAVESPWFGLVDGLDYLFFCRGTMCLLGKSLSGSQSSHNHRVRQVAKRHSLSLASLLWLFDSYQSNLTFLPLKKRKALEFLHPIKSQRKKVSYVQSGASGRLWWQLNDLNHWTTTFNIATSAHQVNRVLAPCRHQWFQEIEASRRVSFANCFDSVVWSVSSSAESMGTDDCSSTDFMVI